MSEFALALESAVTGIATGPRLAKTERFFVSTSPTVVMPQATSSSSISTTSITTNSTTTSDSTSQVPDGIRRRSTTFSQTNGEMKIVPGRSTKRSKSLLLMVGAAALLLASGVLLIHSGKTNAPPTNPTVKPESPKLPPFVAPMEEPPSTLAKPGLLKPEPAPKTDHVKTSAQVSRPTAKLPVGKPKRDKAGAIKDNTPASPKTNSEPVIPTRPKIETNLIKEL